MMEEPSHDKSRPIEACLTSGMPQAKFRFEVQNHLVAKISFDVAEAQVHWLPDCLSDPEFSVDLLDLTGYWPAFRSAGEPEDEIWAFDTVKAYAPFSCGERGFALVRRGQVVKYYVTEIIN